MDRLAALERPRAPRWVVRGRILDAARELFACEGYERTSVRAIAARCGLSDAAVLYHFRSKQELLAALLVEPQTEPIYLPEGGDVDDVIEQLLDHFSTWVDHTDLVQVVLTEALSAHRGAGEFRERSLRSFYLNTRPAIERLAPADCDEISEALAAILSGAMIDGVMHWGRRFPEVARSAAYRAQLRRQCELILPEPGAARAAP